MRASCTTSRRGASGCGSSSPVDSTKRVDHSTKSRVSGMWRCRTSSGLSKADAESELDLPGPDVLVHHEISHQAVERVLEGGRAVLLEEEVADPREAVARQQGVQE